jgi:HEPN domain
MTSSLPVVQVIMNLDAEAPEVRFNEEIKAVAQFRAARAIEAGEDVTESDLKSIEDIMLTDQDPNAGHLTMMLFKGRWIIAFDFRYNAACVAATKDAAREFLDIATFALEQKRMRPFADNLFSATELMAKGILLMNPDRGVLDSKKHTFISRRFNLSGKWGHTDPRYVELLNRLAKLRGAARYVHQEYLLSTEEAGDMLSTAEDMFETLSSSAPKRYEVNDNS